MTKHRIHHADTLEIIDSLGEFDYLITDPPYPVGGHSSHSSASSISQVYEMMDSLSMSIVTEAIRRCRKRSPFACWVMCDWRIVSLYARQLRSLGLTTQACIVWDKVHSNFSALYHPRHELVIFAGEPGCHKKSPGYMGPNIVTAKRSGGPDKVHPFEKPPELVEKMCKAFEPGRVLDPFCGGGGLILGAKKLGWEVVGVDMMRDMCSTAQRRLDSLHQEPLLEESR